METLPLLLIAVTSAIALAGAMIAVGWASFIDVLPIGYLSFLGAVIGSIIGAMTRAPFQRKLVLNSLGSVYVLSQDLWRDMLNFPTRDADAHIPVAERKITEWWREVRMQSPLMGDRGRRLMSEAFAECQSIVRDAKAFGEAVDNSEKRRLVAAIEHAQKSLNARRTMLTSDRRILITPFPDWLDWLRLRVWDKPSDPNVNLSR